MLLAVNIGNTRTNAGWMDEHGQVLSKMAVATSRHADEYGGLVSQVSPDTRVVCASVVPMATAALTQALLTRGAKLELVVPRDDLGLAFGGVDYRELGADLFANALASLWLWNRDVLLVDLGTGSTFCVVKDGVYRGTAIVPGMEISFRALTSGAALLREVPIAKAANVINTTTVECLQAGIYYGYLELVRGMIRRVQQEHGKLFVVLTGGIGAFLCDGLMDVIDRYEPNLTLIGIWRVARAAVVLPTNPPIISD
ncbi:MAG: type III pantothenate kinase [Selenomonadales bacterium]|jgi:type III pantothenate kinase|nr:type III pantothenate kinase [Selenomonadales bacterium]